MQELEEVLRAHAARYPAMEAADYVKLVYQTEFGGDAPAAAVPVGCAGVERASDASSGPLCEPIGDGLCRVPAAALPPEAAPALDRLAAVTAGEAVASEERFLEKLGLLRRLCAAGELPLGSAALEAFLTPYLAAGPRPVPHSAAYRAAYAPCYRVLRQSYADLLPVFLEAERVAARGGVLAVDGRCASGKSTLAALLGRVYGCPVFHLDDFFLTPELRTPERFAQPGGNVHYERFEEEILRPFTQGKEVVFRAFDCHALAMKPPVSVPAAPFAVAEGCYALHPSLRGYYAGAVFLTHSKEKQRQRLLARSGPEMLRRFEQEWIPLEERYFSACGVEAQCGVTLDTTELF